MKYGIFSVRDAKAEAFGQPFFAQQRGLAVRSFSDECERSDSGLNKHPEDYALFHIGEYDDLSGLVTPLAQPVQIALALDYVKLLTA